MKSMTPLRKRIEIAHRFFQESWNSADARDFDRALNLIEKAIRVFPEGWLYQLAKAQFLSDLERFAEASEQARLVTQRRPRVAEGWSMLGQCLAKMCVFEEAAHCFRRAVGIMPMHSTYTLLAAVEYEFDPARAILSAEKALEIWPGWDEALDVIEKASKKLAVQ